VAAVTQRKGNHHEQPKPETRHSSSRRRLAGDQAERVPGQRRGAHAERGDRPGTGDPEERRRRRVGDPRPRQQDPRLGYDPAWQRSVSATRPTLTRLGPRGRIAAVAPQQLCRAWTCVLAPVAASASFGAVSSSAPTRSSTSAEVCRGRRASLAQPPARWIPHTNSPELQMGGLRLPAKPRCWSLERMIYYENTRTNSSVISNHVARG